MRVTAINLLLATDLRTKSDAALSRGAMLGRHLASELTLVHIVSTRSSAKSLDERVHDAMRRIQSLAHHPRWSGQTPPHTLIRAGVPEHAIVEALTDLHPSLLVLGPHEDRGSGDRLARLFGTTVAARALSARICPVLIVREPPRHAYRRLLLALDLSSNAEDVVRAAESLVMDADADASVLHAFDQPYLGSVEYLDAGRGMSARYRGLWQSQATTAVRALLRRSSGDFSRYGIQLEDDPPVGAILHAVNQQEPDLLVMGTSGRGSWRRALLGSVANDVLSQVWCDTLIVPQGTFQRVFTPQSRVARLPTRRGRLSRYPTH